MRFHLLGSAVLALVVPLAAHAGLTDRQSQLLKNNCLQCHARPDIGVPIVGRADDWKARIRQGEDGMLRNVIQGLRGMPPSGYCAACDEADLRALTRAVSGLDGGR